MPQHSQAASPVASLGYSPMSAVAQSRRRTFRCWPAVVSLPCPPPSSR